MKPYQILPHPAELRIRVFGKTREELFKNAALALADILYGTKTKAQNAKQTKKEQIEVQSPEINSLLVDFLNEILARSQINKCVYSASDLTLNSKFYILNSELVGYPIDRFDEDIKAVTYQDVSIRYKIYDLRNKTKLWQTIIVFDI